MSLTISCPACQRPLRVPESLLGKAVKCPGCSHRFTAAEQNEDEAPPPRASSSVRTSRRPSAPPLEEEEAAPRRSERISDKPQPRRERDDDRPSRRRDDDDDYEEQSSSTGSRKAAWNKVRIGINLVMIGIWVWLGGSILAGLGGLLGFLTLGSALITSASSNQAAWGSMGFAGILLILSVGLYYVCVLGEFVLRLVGYGMCMSAPPIRDSGLRPLAITAFALSAVQVLFWCVSFFVGGLNGFAASAFNRSRGLAAGSDAASTGISGLSALCAIGSFVVFLFFLRSVCNNIRARELASKPVSVLIAFVLFWVITVILFVLLACGGGAAVASTFQGQSANRAASSLGTLFIIMIVLGCIAGLIYLGMQVWYIFILQQIRDAVASHRRRL
jgi:predicted Zn finger-like uncharacterized protein